MIYFGYDLITKASELLNDNDKEDFKKYINIENSFYPLQIFVKKFYRNYTNIHLIGYSNVKKYFQILNW